MAARPLYRVEGDGVPLVYKTGKDRIGTLRLTVSRHEAFKWGSTAFPNATVIAVIKQEPT